MSDTIHPQKKATDINYENLSPDQKHDLEYWCRRYGITSVMGHSMPMVFGPGMYLKTKDDFQSSRRQYYSSAWIIFIVLFLQVLVASCITALSAFKIYQVPVTVLGAVNIVVAAVLTLLKASKWNENSWRKKTTSQAIIDNIEQGVMDIVVPPGGRYVPDLVAERERQMQELRDAHRKALQPVDPPNELRLRSMLQMARVPNEAGNSEDFTETERMLWEEKIAKNKSVLLELSGERVKSTDDSDPAVGERIHKLMEKIARNEMVLNAMEGRTNENPLPMYTAQQFDRDENQSWSDMRQDLVAKNTVSTKRLMEERGKLVDHDDPGQKAREEDLETQVVQNEAKIVLLEEADRNQPVVTSIHLK